MLRFEVLPSPSFETSAIVGTLETMAVLNSSMTKMRKKVEGEFAVDDFKAFKIADGLFGLSIVVVGSSHDEN